jgi:hypothetical protein
MGISALLDSALEKIVSDDQGSWRQYVLDHLDYISSRSSIFPIEPTVMNRYRYDLRSFLKYSMNRHQDIGWIVQLLNNIRNDFEFIDKTNLIIPDDSLITQIYYQYKTIISNNR